MGVSLRLFEGVAWPATENSRAVKGAFRLAMKKEKTERKTERKTGRTKERKNGELVYE